MEVLDKMEFEKPISEGTIEEIFTRINEKDSLLKTVELNDSGVEVSTQPQIDNSKSTEEVTELSKIFEAFSAAGNKLNLPAHSEIAEALNPKLIEDLANSSDFSVNMDYSVMMLKYTSAVQSLTNAIYVVFDENPDVDVGILNSLIINSGMSTNLSNISTDFFKASIDKGLEKIRMEKTERENNNQFKSTNGDKISSDSKDGQNDKWLSASPSFAEKYGKYINREIEAKVENFTKQKELKNKYVDKYISDLDFDVLRAQYESIRNFKEPLTKSNINAIYSYRFTLLLDEYNSKVFSKSNDLESTKLELLKSLPMLVDGRDFEQIFDLADLLPDFNPGDFSTSNSKDIELNIRSYLKANNLDYDEILKEAHAKSKKELFDMKYLRSSMTRESTKNAFTPAEELLKDIKSADDLKGLIAKLDLEDKATLAQIFNTIAFIDKNPKFNEETKKLLTDTCNSLIEEERPKFDFIGSMMSYLEHEELDISQTYILISRMMTIDKSSLTDKQTEFFYESLDKIISLTKGEEKKDLQEWLTNARESSNMENLDNSFSKLYLDYFNSNPENPNLRGIKDYRLAAIFYSMREHNKSKQLAETVADDTVFLVETLPTVKAGYSMIESSLSTDEYEDRQVFIPILSDLDQYREVRVNYFAAEEIISGKVIFYPNRDNKNNLLLSSLINLQEDNRKILNGLEKGVAVSKYEYNSDSIKRIMPDKGKSGVDELYKKLPEILKFLGSQELVNFRSKRIAFKNETVQSLFVDYMKMYNVQGMEKLLQIDDGEFFVGPFIKGTLKIFEKNGYKDLPTTNQLMGEFIKPAYKVDVINKVNANELLLKNLDKQVDECSKEDLFIELNLASQLLIDDPSLFAAYPALKQRINDILVATGYGVPKDISEFKRCVSKCSNNLVEKDGVDPYAFIKYKQNVLLENGVNTRDGMICDLIQGSITEDNYRKRSFILGSAIVKGINHDEDKSWYQAGKNPHLMQLAESVGIDPKELGNIKNMNDFFAFVKKHEDQFGKKFVDEQTLDIWMKRENAIELLATKKAWENHAEEIIQARNLELERTSERLGIIEDIKIDHGITNETREKMEKLLKYDPVSYKKVLDELFVNQEGTVDASFPGAVKAIGDQYGNCKNTALTYKPTVIKQVKKDIACIDMNDPQQRPQIALAAMEILSVGEYANDGKIKLDEESLEIFQGCLKNITGKEVNISSNDGIDAYTIAKLLEKNVPNFKYEGLDKAMDAAIGTKSLMEQENPASDYFAMNNGFEYAAEFDTLNDFSDVSVFRVTGNSTTLISMNSSENQCCSRREDEEEER